MVRYLWNPAKNVELSERPERGVSFEEIVTAIEKGGLLDDISHPRPDRYPNQRVLVVPVRDYVYAVPYVRDGDVFFLKTIFPSRALKAKYLPRRR